MSQPDAAGAVLTYIRVNERFDPRDEGYVLMDDKLKPLFDNLPRVSLMMLAKRLSTYMVRDHATKRAVKGGEGDTSPTWSDLGARVEAAHMQLRQLRMQVSQLCLLTPVLPPSPACCLRPFLACNMCVYFR